MFRNYLKIAMRVLFRQKQYVLINTLGLTIGLAVSLLIVAFIINELGFDHCHEKLDRIYRVDGSYKFGDSGVSMASIMPPLGPAMAQNYPDIESVVRIRRLWDVLVEFGSSDLIEAGKVFAAEPSYFNVFTVPLLNGDPETALNDPMSITISEEISEIHFAGQNPLGQTIRLLGEYDFQVTGIMARLPVNTQLRSDFIISYASLEKIGEVAGSWTDIFQDYTYLLLNEGADPVKIEQSIPELLEKYLEPDKVKMYDLQLQPLRDIYLHSGLSYELPPRGDLGAIYIVSWIAGLILIIACINFINLATAKTSHRMKEVGVRKVLGAFRFQLVKQFIGESLLLTFISMLFGIALFEISLPYLEAYLKRNLAVSFPGDPFLVLSIASMILVVGVFSGSYPAFVLSRFLPTDVLRGASPGSSTRSILRKILVVVQFAIASTLICASFAIHNQINYSLTTDLGFDKDNVLLIAAGDDITDDQRQLLKSRIKSVSGEIFAAITSSSPGENRYNLYSIRPENNPEADYTLINGISTDIDFLSTFNIKLIKGSNFSADIGAENNPIIINEAAVREYEIDNPIGFKLLSGKTEYNVIGVTKDFHMHSLHNEIMPCMIMQSFDLHRLIAVKLNPDKIPESIAGIRGIWSEIFPALPFNYSFLENSIRENYETEAKIAKLLAAFSIIAIFVACLGLFGLAAFSTEQRVKEIGVRKALGASVSSIVALISREIVFLVVAANLIGWPVAYFVMDRLLQDFAYRGSMGWEIYFLAGSIVAVVALATVGIQAFKAATANPVDSLRHE